MIPDNLIPARTRIFSDRAVGIVTRTSRTTRWRKRKSRGGNFPDPVRPHEKIIGHMGIDVVVYMQAMRAEAGLPPMDEADILVALVAAEDAVTLEKAAEAASRKAAA